MIRLTGPSAARLGRAARLRLDVLRHAGKQVYCPICRRRFSEFKGDWNRPGALCWRCGSHERHRAQWLLFERRIELLLNAESLLHFAPEWGLRRRLERIPGLRYITADMHQPGSGPAP